MGAFFISQNERAMLNRQARMEAERLISQHGARAAEISESELKKSPKFSKRRTFWKAVQDKLNHYD